MARTREFDTDKALADIADKFWADGYEATGVADLVEATGVGRASLYGAFGSKQEMLHRAVERYLDTDIELRWSSVDGNGLEGATHMFRQFAFLRETRPERAQWGCLMVNSVVELGRTDEAIVELGGRYLGAGDTAHRLASRRFAFVLPGDRGAAAFEFTHDIESSLEQAGQSASATHTQVYALGGHVDESQDLLDRLLGLELAHESRDPEPPA